MTGKLVTLEGIDGSGKSTVAKLLLAEFERRGKRTAFTQEPTRGWLGQALKRSIRSPDANPVAEALLFMADHAQHLVWVKGQLAEGMTVVSDRYSDSCYAYQGAVLASFGGFGDRALDWLIALQEPFNRPPDVALLLDVSPDVAMARIGARGDRIKFEEPGFLAHVRGNYDRLAKRFPYYEVVDASGPTEAVVEECILRLEKRAVL